MTFGWHRSGRSLMLVKVIGRLYPIQCCTLGARDIIQLQQLICEQYALSFVFICVFCEQYSLSFMLICVFCKQYSLRQLLFSHGTICLGLLVNCFWFMVVLSSIQFQLNYYFRHAHGWTYMLNYWFTLFVSDFLFGRSMARPQTNFLDRVNIFEN